jgi:hypothetical protein
MFIFAGDGFRAKNGLGIPAFDLAGDVARAGLGLLAALGGDGLLALRDGLIGAGDGFFAAGDDLTALDARFDSTLFVDFLGLPSSSSEVACGAAFRFLIE